MHVFDQIGGMNGTLFLQSKFIVLRPNIDESNISSLILKGFDFYPFKIKTDEDEVQQPIAKNFQITTRFGHLDK